MVYKADTGTTTQTKVVEQCICLLDAIYSNFECQEFISTLQDLETKVLSGEYKDLDAFQLELQNISQIPFRFQDTVTLRSMRKHPELYTATPMYNSINFRKESLLYTVNIPNYHIVHSSLYDASENSNCRKSVHRLFIRHNPELLIESRDNFNIILTLFLNARVKPCTNNQLSHVNAQTAAVHSLGEYHALSTSAAQTSGFHGWIKVKIAKLGHINTIIPSELAGQVFSDQLSVHKLSTTQASTINNAKANEAKQQFIHTIMGITTDAFSTLDNSKIENILNALSHRKFSPKSTIKTSATEPIVNTDSSISQSFESIKIDTTKPIGITASNAYQSSSKALRNMKKASIHKKSTISKEIFGTDATESIREKFVSELEPKMMRGKKKDVISPGHRQGMVSRNHLSAHINKPSLTTLSPYLTGRPQLNSRFGSLSKSKIKLEAVAVSVGLQSEAEVEQLGISDNHISKAPDNASIFEIDDSGDCVAEKRSSSQMKPVIKLDVIEENVVLDNHWHTLEEFCMKKNVDIVQKDQLDIPYTSNVADAAGYFKKIYYTKDNQVAQIFVRSTASQKILEIIPLLMLKNSPHVGQVKGVIFDQNEPIGLTMHRYEMTLEKYLKNHKHQKLSPAQRLHIILQLLESVQESHQAGIAHRDLSTVNFMIDSKTEREKPDVYLIDFGKAVFTDPQVTFNWWFSPFLQDDKQFRYEDEVVPTTKEELIVWCKNLPMVMAKPDHGYPMYRSIQTLPCSVKDKGILPHLIDPLAEDIYSLGAIIWRVFSDMQPWPGVLDTSFKDLRDACKSDYHIDKVLERNISGTKSRELLQMFLRVRPEDRKSIAYVKRWIQSEENKWALLEEWSLDRKSKGESTRKVDKLSTTKARKQGKQRQVQATATEEENNMSRVPSLSPQLEFTQHALSRQSSQSSLSSLVPLPEQVYDTNNQKRKVSGNEYDSPRVKRREVEGRLS